MNFSTISILKNATRLALAFTATALLASSASAHEGDHWPVAADQLRMTYDFGGDGSKFSFKAKKQLNINAVSLSQDPTIQRSTLLVRGSGASAGTSEVIELDPTRWTRIGSASKPKGWRFKGSPYYTHGVTKVQIKNNKKGGSLQIQAKGQFWPFAINGPQDSVEVVLTIGDFAFCAEVSDDREAEFKSNEAGEVSARYSLAPSGCPLVCGNGVIEIGEECDDGNLIDNDTCSNTCVGCNPSDAEFATTFEGIQQLIFDNPTYACSNDACHGSALSGGLDLRAGASHTALVGVPSSIAPGTQRVFPGDQDLSLLYNKLAENTLGSPNAPGSGMPVGGMITEDHLAALRLWIRGGASETGVVPGSAELLGSCLPAPTPLNIPQPPVPDSAVGTQFAMPGYNLKKNSETEGCIATYYDVSATVPANMLVDCPGAFPGTNETGPLAGKCFTYNTNDLFQDAQSHHSIVHIYPGDHTWTDPGWGGWTCYEGPTPGAVCDPSVANACGTGGVCGSAFYRSTACIPNIAGPWGAPDFNSSTSPQFSGSQESTATLTGPAGVYYALPVKGLIVWNSHAFNLTNEDTSMNGWINVEYTDNRQWPAQGLFDSRFIFTQNVLPFEQKEYCATYTFPANAHLFQLSSHTHKRGIRWRYYDAPQTPCTGFGGGNTSPSCTPGAEGDIFYESYDYSDATNLKFDPPKVFGSSTNDRTVKYCAVFDNGLNDPTTVKTQSGSPNTAGNFFLGGPCTDELTYCNGGANKGQLCYGNDDNCPGSVCDACALRGGTTTEDEMFIALGTYYVP